MEQYRLYSHAWDTSMKKQKRKTTLFTNGSVYIRSDFKAENLMIQDDRVVGFNVNESLYKDAEVVDLKGGTAYPGFMDNHSHLLVSAAIAQVGIQLNGAVSARKIADILAAEASRIPDGVPIFGHGFVFDDYEAWSLKDLAILDNATGSRPVMLSDQLIHSYIANSTAMEMSGVTGETPNPPGGKIVLENGRPTGMLRENAGCLVGNIAIFPLFTTEMMQTGTEEILNIWASKGYTSILEMMGGPGGQVHKPDLFRRLEAEGRLPLRVNYTYTVYDLDGIDQALADIGNDTDMVRFAGLKLFVDGAAGNGGAWTSWENALGEHGIYAVSENDSYGEKYNINRIIEKTDRYGLDIRYHTHGDRAIGIVLDAIESVLEEKGRLSSVHTLYHLGFITDDQILRMKKLGRHVIAGLQPSLGWEYSKEITPRFYGNYAKGSYPYRKMGDAGITLGMGSDFCSNTLALSGPTMHMKAALTGAGDPENHPALTMKEMIDGFTVSSAASTYLRDVGQLDIGYKADLVVYDKDLYDVPAEELDVENPKVLSTWINGRKIYDAAAG